MIKTRVKRSLLWKIPIDELRTKVRQSKTFSEILVTYGFQNKGGNHKTLKNRLNFDKIDFSHIKEGLGSGKGIHRGGFEYTNEQIFIQNSTLHRGVPKRRILRDKLIPYVCLVCGLKPCWQKKKLVLIIDHINGINNDDRIENLRFVCPNCNSQLNTFCSRNGSKKYSQPLCADNGA